MIYWYMAAIKTRMRYASGFCFYVGVKFFTCLYQLLLQKNITVLAQGGDVKKRIAAVLVNKRRVLSCKMVPALCF